MAEERAKVLLVDDQESNLIALEAALGKSNYGFIRARSGREALGLACEHDFAVILLDVQMPGLDGFATARLMRGVDRAKITPIIFLTANFPGREYVAQGYGVGAVDYLSKPLDMEILRAKVSVFVDLFRKNIETKREAEHLRQLERRESDKRLARIKQISDRRYKRLIEGIQEGIVWIADLKLHRFLFVSPQAERITGIALPRWFSEEHFWEEHLHPDDRMRLSGALDHVPQNGTTLSFEHRFRKSSGDYLWFHTGIHLEEGDGGPELCGLSVDITHLKETERALRESIRSRDEFLSVASHELRTPITPLQLQMQGFLRMLDTGKLETIPSEKLRSMLEISDSQVARLARTIEQLLDVSRLTAGRLNLNIETVNLSDLIHAIAERLRHEIDAAECSLLLRIEPNVTGKWDLLRLEQIIVNLLINSLKYGGGKPIELTLEQVKGHAKISVVDEGIGIDKKDQERIFEKFERAVSSRHFGGLGLGLYITKQMVELHRGTIEVESEIGCGAKFTALLPLEAVPLERNAREKSGARLT